MVTALDLKQAMQAAQSMDNFALSHLNLLLTVKLSPGLPQIEAAREAGISRAGTSWAVEKMTASKRMEASVEHALIRVEEDPKDHRVNLLYLTPRGEKFIEEILTPLNHYSKGVK